MKKSLLLLAALALGASAAMAQVENPVLPTAATFRVDGQVIPQDDLVELDSVVKTLTVTFDIEPNVPATIMYATGIGDAIGMSYTTQDKPAQTIQIPLTRESWGYPFNEKYYLNLVVTFSYEVEIDGETTQEYYLNDDEEPVFFQIMLTTDDTGKARFEKYAPNNGMFNDYYTFDNAYEDGNMYVYFSKVVTAPTNVAHVTYYDTNGAFLDEQNVSLSSQEWSDMDGLYQILFNYTSSDIEASDLSRIEIQLSPVTWINDDEDNVVIDSPVIVLNNAPATPQAAPRKVKKGMTNGLSVATENGNVYNLQGMLVLKNASISDINNLAPGMYIVNGKKVTVK